MWLDWAWFLLAIFTTILSQPVTDDQNAREVRNVDGECCPCPTIGRSGKNLEAAAASRDGLGDLDDCPCRVRDADAEGAPSLLAPAVRAFQPVMRPNTPKEDLKPILHPEVNLASSVLETLREATDEEYQEALARDAARDASIITDPMEPSLKDPTPEESKRSLITIIVNPNEGKNDKDFIAEASHVQEARYATAPQESTKSGTLFHSPDLNSPNLLNEIFKVPTEPISVLHRNTADMDIGASNIQEQITDSISKSIGELKLKSSPALFSLFPSKEGVLLKDLNRNTLNKDTADIIKVPDLRLSSVLDKINDTLKIKPLELPANKLNKPLIPKIKLDLFNIGDKDQIHKKNINTLDNNILPSNIQENVFKINNNKEETTGINSKSAMETTTSKPFLFKNLFKLKDVELFDPLKVLNTENKNAEHPRTTPKPFVFIPTLKPQSNVQIIPRDKVVKIEILDTVPSPSNIQTVTVPNPNNDVNNNNQNNINNFNNCFDQSNTALSKLNTKPRPIIKNPETEILDVVPNTADISGVPSENIVDDVISNTDEIKSANSDELFEQIDMNNESEEIPILSNIDEEKNADEFDNEIEFEDIGAFDDSENGQTFINFSDEQQITSSENLNQNNINLQDPELNPTNNLFHTASIEKQENDEVSIEDLPIDIEDNVIEVQTVENDRMETPNKNINGILSLLSQNSKAELFRKATFKNVNCNTVQPSDNIKNNDLSTMTPSPLEESVDQRVSSGTENELNTSGEESDTISTTNRLNIFDLQKMSDNILNLSKKKEENVRDSDRDVKNTNRDENKVFKANVDSFEHTDEKGSETMNSETSTDQDENTNNLDLDGKEDLLLENSENIAKNLNKPVSDENFNENECLSDLSAADNSKGNEMLAESSIPVVNVVPSILSNPTKDSLLRQNFIIQPSSTDSGTGLNIFNRPLPDINQILNINSKLPTLDDMFLKIPGLFDANSKTIGNGNIGFNNNLNLRAPLMSTSASSSSPKLSTPSVTPFEEIDLDLFQLRPLPLPQLSPLQPKRLNLNSYKAKLPIPSTLDLKPLKFESAIGDKSGILGATLTVKPDKIKSARPGSAILGERLTNLPTIDDLKDTLKMRTQNLFSTPSLGESLLSNQQINDISENIRANTENALRNIQQTLESSLLETRSESLAQPEDLLEMVARTHEDVNDKLKALHIDLNDRLATFQENLFDQSRLASIDTPLITPISWKSQDLSRATKLPLKTSSKVSIKASKPVSRKQKLRSGKKNVLNDFNLQSTQPMTDSRTVRLQSKNNPTASANTFVPKTVEGSNFNIRPLSVPILKSQPTQNALNLKKEKPQLLSDRKQFPMLKKPLKDNNAKVSFPARPPVPTLRNPKTSVTTIKSPKPSRQNPIKNKAIKKMKIKQRQQTIGPLRDASELPTEVITTRIPPPTSKLGLSRPLIAQRNNKAENFPETRLPMPPVTQTPPRLPLPKLDLKDPLLSLNKDEFVIKLPEITAPPSLAKLRESIKATLASVDGNKEEGLGASNSEFDTFGSPTEQFQDFRSAEEPMREKTRYTCRMICTKED